MLEFFVYNSGNVILKAEEVFYTVVMESKLDPYLVDDVPGMQRADTIKKLELPMRGMLPSHAYPGAATLLCDVRVVATSEEDLGPIIFLLSTPYGLFPRGSLKQRISRRFKRTPGVVGISPVYGPVVPIKNE
jgi:hypothetical protein